MGEYPWTTHYEEPWWNAFSHSSKFYQRDLIYAEHGLSCVSLYPHHLGLRMLLRLFIRSTGLFVRSCASLGGYFFSLRMLRFSICISCFRILYSSIFVRLFGFSALSLLIVVISTCSVISILVFVYRLSAFSALRATDVEAGHSIWSRLLLYLFAFRSNTSLRIRTWKSVAILRMDKMMETALPEDLEAAIIRSSSQTGWSRNMGGKCSNRKEMWKLVL